MTRSPVPADAFRHWTDIPIRYSDQDGMGHVNNASYVVYVETARVPFLYQFFDPDAERIDVVLANLEIDYHRETRYPGMLRVGARLVGVGSKSVRTEYGVYREDECLATARCVNVFFDPVERRSMAPPQAVRRRIEARLTLDAGGVDA